MSVIFSHTLLDQTLGAALLGNLAAAVFYGVTNVQVFMYYKYSRSDSTLLKYSIFALWVLDTLHLALVTSSVYFCAVTNYANPMALTIPSWSLKAHIIATGCSDAIVRGIFCQRMWSLSKGNWYLTSVIAASTVCAFAGSVAFSIKSFVVIGDVFHLSKISWILYASLGSGVVTDIIVTVSLCVLLQRFKTGYPSTKSLVRILMLYGINTGALTSLCEVACLIAYVTMPNNLIFIAIFFVLPKLLLNALLATLNARVSLQESRRSKAWSSPSIKPLLRPYSSTPSTRDFRSSVSPTKQQMVNVTIHRDTISVADAIPQRPKSIKLAPHRLTSIVDLSELERGRASTQPYLQHLLP